LIRVIRRYDFSAAHVLARPDWSDVENRRVYGKCANPAGHGHNYRVEVAIEGELDPSTGHVLPPAELDALVAERVLRELDGRFLNREVAVFEKRVPTAENIARHIWDSLVRGVAPARLVGIRLVETRNNSVEYAGSEELP
jgi:6-pyruvoyltetrahydropterin/6-carboxytetrahydropterin synthase